MALRVLYPERGGYHQSSTSSVKGFHSVTPQFSNQLALLPLNPTFKTRGLANQRLGEGVLVPNQEHFRIKIVLIATLSLGATIDSFCRLWCCPSLFRINLNSLQVALIVVEGPD